MLYCMRKEEKDKSEMVKVQCISCGNTGYTASPDHTVCQCGGSLREVQEDSRNQNEDKH